MVLRRLLTACSPSENRVSCPFSSCCICWMAARSCGLLRQLCGNRDGDRDEDLSVLPLLPGANLLAWEEAGVGAPQHPVFPECPNFVFSPTFTQIQEFFPPRPALQAGLGLLCGRDAITHVSSCWSSSPVPLPHDKRRGKQLSCELCRGQERWWDSCLQTNRSLGTDSCLRRAPSLWDSCGIDLKPGKKTKAIPRAQKSGENS